MIHKIKLPGFFCLIIYILAGCNNHSKDTSADTGIPAAYTPLINYAVKASYPHDTALFTEGFLMHNGQLFESTGSPENLPQAKSMIGISDLKTGKFDEKASIDRKYFGEGIVFFNNKLYELTYKAGIGFIYDANSYKRIDSFTYKNAEGWSLTTNGREIIMDDGTDVLTFLDPVTLKPTRQLKVTDNGQPQDSLNELEFIKGLFMLTSGKIIRSSKLIRHPVKLWAGSILVL